MSPLYWKNNSSPEEGNKHKRKCWKTTRIAGAAIGTFVKMKICTVIRVLSADEHNLQLPAVHQFVANWGQEELFVLLQPFVEIDRGLDRVCVVFFLHLYL